MEEAVAAHLASGGLERVFYLGDGLWDLAGLRDRYPGLSVEAVSGNCDRSLFSEPEEPVERVVRAGGFTFFMTHGHKYGVKSSLGALAARAGSLGADVALFGHTHERTDQILETDGGPVRLINPGSVGTWYDASFALLEIVGRQVICGFGLSNGR